ncbi:MAG: hypothetical protein ACKVTZ_13640 [Bacteroidia bacterium]
MERKKTSTPTEPTSLWRKVSKIRQAFIYAMPIRLFVLQLQQNPLLVGLWLFVCLLLTGNIGKSMGVHYIFLEPEYLGKVGFASYFLIGAALGGFTFAYMVSSYLSMSYRFHFLATQKYPFFVFSLNNVLLPCTFLGLYIGLFLKMRIQEEHSVLPDADYQVGRSILALLLGATFLFFSLAGIVFASTRNIFQNYGDELEKWVEKQRNLKRAFFAINILRQKKHSPYRTDSFLSLHFRFINLKTYKPIPIVKVLAAMHGYQGRLLLLQALMVLSLLMFSYFDDIAYFQLPAGVSSLMALTFIVVISGALTFWVRRLGFWAIILFIIGIQIYPHLRFLREENQAFGLNYDVQSTPYNLTQIKNHVSLADSIADYQQTLSVLEKWKQNWQEKYGKDKLPTAIFVCASGGGSRAALLTMLTLQHLDSLTQGKSTQSIRLMTGASGGVLGLAYFREAILHQQKRPITAPYYPINLGKDLLNRTFFRTFADPFLPNLKVKVGQHKYDKERGYAFDQQAIQNMPELKGKKLGDYAAQELAAQIPQLIINPSIIHQAKPLYISSLGVSYMTQPLHIASNYQADYQGIEFRRFFAKHQPDSLSFLTALRMNATFPYIFPIVYLPSSPKMYVMDAGILENFGITTSVKYVRIFQDWLKKNTAQQIFVTIRDTEKETPILPEEQQKSVLNDWISPIGGGFGSLMERDEYLCDEMLYSLQKNMGAQMQVISIQYPIHSLENPASLNIHLTTAEKQKVRSVLALPNNKSAFLRFAKMMK